VLKGITDGLGIITHEDNSYALDTFGIAMGKVEEVMPLAFENPLSRWRYLSKSIVLLLKLDNDHSNMAQDADEYLAKTREVYNKLLQNAELTNAPTSAAAVPEKVSANDASGGQGDSENDSAGENSDSQTPGSILLTSSEATGDNDSTATPASPAITTGAGYSGTTNVASVNSAVTAGLPATAGIDATDDGKAAVRSVDREQIGVARDLAGSDKKVGIVGGHRRVAKAKKSKSGIVVVPDSKLAIEDDGSSSKNRKNSFDITPGAANYATGEASATEGRVVAAEGDLNNSRKYKKSSGKDSYNEASINKQKDVSIFQIVSSRYLKTGFSYLGVD
jgi:hypothetical protein